MFVALFLLFSTLSLSLSICVRDERSPISSCSSIIIVPKSDIVDNSVTLIVELESQFESECQIETTTDAAIEGASLKITQYENYTSIPIPSGIREGKHIVSLSYTYNGCDKEKVTLSHEIYVHILDNPELVHESEDPHILHCKTDTDLSTLWVEFIKNSKAIGYCGPFTSPVQHKEHATVYYDSSISTCVLKIDTESITANGAYYCSLILPFPDEDGFLKTNSSSVEIKNADSKDSKLVLILAVGIVLGVLFLCLLTTVTVVVGIMCYKHCKPNRKHQPLKEEPATVEERYNHNIGTEGDTTTSKFNGEIDPKTKKIIANINNNMQ